MATHAAGAEVVYSGQAVIAQVVDGRGEGTMAILVVVDVRGLTKDQYEMILRQANPDRQMPAGEVMFAAGPTETGWRVVEMWESREAWAAMMDGAVRPGLKMLGAAEPDVSIMEVHHFVGPSRPG